MSRPRRLDKRFTRGVVKPKKCSVEWRNRLRHCRYKNDFQYDLRQCDKALHMGGPMQIEAQCWMNLLDQLEEGDIKAYVQSNYRPGALDPFRKK